MNRLQKKCVIVTAGVHLLLLLILIVGPAFFSPKPKEDDLQVLDVIPANLIDANASSGVANAQLPPPEPVVRPPEPEPAKVEPPKPVIKDPEKSLTPPDKPKEVRKPEISKKLVVRTTPKAAPDANAPLSIVSSLITRSTHVARKGNAIRFDVSYGRVTAHLLVHLDHSGRLSDAALPVFDAAHKVVSYRDVAFTDYDRAPAVVPPDASLITRR